MSGIIRIAHHIHSFFAVVGCTAVGCVVVAARVSARCRWRLLRLVPAVVAATATAAICYWYLCRRA
eukprot:7323838-Lingulodinium_polyedra.AAC.1